MINRISVQGYKSLENTDLKLQKLCVLFGPNAAGKSNFLDALQLLASLVKSPTLSDSFRPPYRGSALESFTLPAGGMRELLSTDTAVMRFEVDVTLSESTIRSVERQIREMRRTKADETEQEIELAETGSQYVREHSLRYILEVEVVPRSGFLRVRDEQLCALTMSGEPRKDRNPFLQRMGHRLHLRTEKRSHPEYHDLLLDHTVLSLPLYPPHYPHVAALKKELASWSFFYFEPRERMRRPNPIKEARRIGPMGDDLAAFLNTLRATSPKEFRGVSKALRSMIPTITGIDVQPNDLGEVELNVLEGDMSIPASVVSDGTLRVLGLLSLNASPEPMTLLGFEEPENGVHPRRIRLMAELLQSRLNTAGTQVIITTHSPLLAEILPEESLYLCRKLGSRTEIIPFPSFGDLFRKSAIDDVLEERRGKTEKPPLSERILRGDFDA
jgi:predicted ATPase